MSSFNFLFETYARIGKFEPQRNCNLDVRKGPAIPFQYVLMAMEHMSPEKQIEIINEMKKFNSSQGIHPSYDFYTTYKPKPSPSPSPSLPPTSSSSASLPSSSSSSFSLSSSIPPPPLPISNNNNFFPEPDAYEWGEEQFGVSFGEGPIGLHMVEDNHPMYGRYIVVKAFAKNKDGQKSPAEACGKINPGDILVRVNEDHVLGFSFDGLVKLLGGCGRPVIMAFHRPRKE